MKTKQERKDEAYEEYEKMIEIIIDKYFKLGRNQAISGFKEKLKDKLFYGDYLHFKKDEKKIISNLLNKTAQEMKA